MRGAWIWALLLIAAAVGGWLVFGGGGDPDDGSAIVGGGDVEDEGEPGPALKGVGGATQGTPRVPVDIRGRGMIQGVTRRAGEGVPATVELRHVQEIDTRDPFKGGVETQFIARLLDGGISSKEVIARTETDADGAFAFRGLATGLYELRASVDDGAMGFASAVLPARGARVEASVDIPDGDQALTGRIVYANGTPFRGTVLASIGSAFAMMMGGGSKSMPAFTDAEGRFKIAGLTPGRYQVSALIPGVLRVMGAPIQVPYDGEYTLTINAAGTEVKGKVIDAETEEPVAGATVFGGGGDPDSSFSIFTTTSDAAGAFTLTIPAGRGGGMFVRAPAYAAQTVDFGGGGPSSEITVALLRLASLGGRVTAKAGGEPVAGVTVFAMGSSGRGMMPTPGTAVTDADGRFSLEGIDPGSVKVWALGGGFVSVGLSGGSAFLGATNTPYTAELEPGQAGTLDLEAEPAGRVEGRVLTEDGSPIPGAVVQATGGNTMPPQLAVAFLGMGQSWGTAVTDADGAFVIDVLIPGSKYKVTAKAPDHPTATSSEFIAAGGKTEDVEIRMKAPRWLEVTVVDAETGKPVPGAGILAVSSSGGREVMMEMLGGGAMWSTNAEGTTRIGPLPEGALRMQVTASGYIDHDDTRIEAGQVAPVTVELKKGLVIAGTVVLPDGVPVQSLRITVRRSGASGGWFQKRAGVQPDGRWRVDSIEEADTYKVEARGVWKDRVFTAELDVEAGTEDVEIVLREDMQAKQELLTVTVLDQDGKLVPAGRVQLWRFHGENMNSTSTSRTRLGSGTATIRGFNTDGEVWVEVYDLIGSKRGATIQGPVTFSDGKLEVRLGAPRTIGGLVTDQDGRAVAGVKITAEAVHPRPGTDRSGSEHASTVTGTDGRFELKGLGDLTYTLDIEPPADYTRVDSIKAKAGTADVGVSLTMGRRVTLTVLGFDGNPVPGCFVWTALLEPHGNVADGGRTWDTSNVTGSDGTITLRGLATDAKYNLTVNAPQGRKDLKQIERKGWTPADETLQFERAWSITGTVVDQDGRPVAGARIQRRKVGEKNFIGWDRTNDEGAFSIDGLGAGSYDLRVRGSAVSVARPGGSPAEEGVVRARAGATGVELVVDQGLKLVVTIADGRSSDGRQRTAWLRPVGASGQVEATWNTGSKLTFQGLREGVKYTLWIAGLDGGKYVAVDGIDGRAGTLEVVAQAGGVIEGTVKVPAGVTPKGIHVSATNERGQSHGVRVDGATGRFRLEGLPHEGTWKVQAFAWADGGTRYRADASATTGAVVTLELKGP